MPEFGQNQADDGSTGLILSLFHLVYKVFPDTQGRGSVSSDPQALNLPAATVVMDKWLPQVVVTSASLSEAWSTNWNDSGTAEPNLRKIYHNGVIKWKHFPRYWPLVRGIHRSPVNFPHKGQWRGAWMFSLIYAWTNSWVNTGDAGDLRRHHGHCNVIVITYAPLFRGGEDYVCESPVGDSSFVMNGMIEHSKSYL